LFATTEALKDRTGRAGVGFLACDRFYLSRLANEEDIRATFYNNTVAEFAYAMAFAALRLFE